MGRGAAARSLTAAMQRAPARACHHTRPNLHLTKVAEGGQLGPSQLDLRRQLWPKRCSKDGIPQAWWHGNDRARSLTPAMPPSFKVAARHLKTFEAPKAAAYKDGTVPHVRSQGERCGASLQRADLRPFSLPRSVCTYTEATGQGVRGLKLLTYRPAKRQRWHGAAAVAARCCGC